MAVLVLDFFLTTDFASRLLLESSVHHFMDYTSADQGQLKRKSVNSN